MTEREHANNDTDEIFKGREWLKEYLTKEEQQAFIDAVKQERKIKEKIESLEREIELLRCSRTSSLERLVHIASRRRMIDERED
jgi:hypothetical protein